MTPFHPHVVASLMVASLLLIPGIADQGLAASALRPLGEAQSGRATVSDSPEGRSAPVLVAWDLRRWFGRPEKKKEAPPPPAPKQALPPAAPAPSPAPPATPAPAPSLPPPKPPAPPVPSPPPPKLPGPPMPSLAPPKPPPPAAVAPKAPIPKAKPQTPSRQKQPPPAARVVPAPQPLTGPALARRVYDREAGRDAVATIEMVLTSRSGHERVRHFESRVRRHDGLEDSLIRFTYPANIKDTAFLTLEEQGGETEQFLYLPALRRVRRIVAKQKGKSFVNSDLYYQDLERRHPDKDMHTLVGEARVGAWHCWILESVPREANSSAYGKVRVWIDQDSLLPVQSEAFDKKGKEIKISHARRIEKIDGIWTMMDSEVTTLDNQHTTRLTTQEVQYDVGLDASAFTKRALEE